MIKESIKRQSRIIVIMLNWIEFVKSFLSGFKQKLILANLFATFSSLVSDIAPNVGKWLSDGLVRVLFANLLFVNFVMQKAKTKANKCKRNSVLVVGDLNIGDAINIQNAMDILKKAGFKKIDYVINKIAYPLIRHNPIITNIYPIFSPHCSFEDSKIYLKQIIESYDYDLILNFCPFLSKPLPNKKTISVLPLSMFVANQYFKKKGITHVAYLIHSYIAKLFDENINFSGTKLYLSSKAINQAREFFKNKIKNKAILFNTDATSIYTLVPFEMQLSILNYLSSLEDYTVILSASFFQRNLQSKLYQQASNKGNIILLDNNSSIDFYAALIDMCDCFISADTGSLHIACAFKYDEQQRTLTNKTAIFSIFGATSASMYGYDSQKERFLKTDQDAISKVYISQNTCRNITCINKKAKRCKKFRCFDGLSAESIAFDIINCLRQDV